MKTIKTTIHTRFFHFHAAFAMGLLLLLGACSGDQATDDTEPACRTEGCTCIFATDCDGDLQCFNGKCTADHPFVDLLPGADVVLDLRQEELDLAPADNAGTETVTDQPFQAPCSENSQCADGWCVDSPDGGYCSQPCEKGCPDGWVCKAILQTSPDFLEVCVLDKTRLCLACEQDSHCGDAGDLCLDIGGGSFCARDCSVEPCPQGYTCSEVDKEGVTYNQCLPVNGTCDCSEESEGQIRACQASNEFGTCFGHESCDPQEGWIGCDALEPTEEMCDGLDNDCDGTVDDELESSDCTIENEFGLCPGTQTCQGLAGWVCSAKTPTAESCNGLDDNCDGAVDEGFVDDDGYYLTTTDCGACGNSCMAKFGGALEVACELVGDDETCVIVSCQDGYFLYNELTCMDENALLCHPCKQDSDCYGDFSQCVPVSDTDPRTFCARSCAPDSPFSEQCPSGYACETVEEALLCMPVNDSCDCSQNNAGQTKACTVETEFGICFGQEECDPELGWVGCTAATPEAEVCDGVDNDCDGMLDEETASGDPCEVTNEFGTCTGTEICGGEEGLLCSAGVPAPESCNGLDDNCDGTIDEGFALTVGEPPVLKYGLSTDHCGVCGYVCPDIPNGTPACDIEPAVPVCVVGECDPGTYDYLSVACIPVPDESSLCQLCLADTDCPGPKDLCIPEIANQGFCSRDCAVGSIYSTEETPCTGEDGQQGCCPDGYLCQVSGENAQCLPLSGSCSCVQDGKVESCTITNEHGTCYGSQTCQLGGENPGWSDCSALPPAAETCDGADNDCDGLVDAVDNSLDFSSSPTGGPDCDHGPGCLGTWQCLAGDWWCNAKTPLDETCNGQDDDCDGDADEDFITDGLYTTAAHCGGCGNNCDAVIANSIITECQVKDGIPVCVAIECAPGTIPFANGQVCIQLPDNLCQPCATDADCLVPSSRCVTIGVESFCGRSCAAQSPFGTECPEGYQCADFDGTPQCVPDSGSCICGAETLGLSRPCTVGACIGTQVCEANGDSFAFTECSAEGILPEVCDGVDNDCDGEADEGFLNPAGQYATDENCGVCGNNCLVQVSQAAHHAIAGCDVEADPPECKVAQCTTQESEGVLYEFVDTNGVLDDGCECRRVAGNVDGDEPDLIFIPQGGQDPAYPAADSKYVDNNCDGIDGVIGHALFVSAANPLPGDGSLASPFQSIGDALDALPGSGKAYVLVAGGLYEENLSLYPGARLHGGYSPDFTSRNILLFTTEIRGVVPDFGAPGTVPGTVYAEGIAGNETVLSGFTVVGYDLGDHSGTGAGEPSYACFVRDCDDSLVLRNNWFIGGMGASGQDGGSGSTGYGAQSGGGAQLHGGNGLNAGSCLNGTCNGASAPGGPGGQNSQCPQANGPTGGGVGCPTYNQPAYVPADPNHDGYPGWNWTLDSSSWGSCGSHATEAGYPDDIKKMDGGSGADGADGADGSQGTGCTAASGSIVNGTWHGGMGASGALGAAGQAGGSGGSSGGIDSASAQEMPPGVNPYSGSRYMLGATGGGGGAAGCGGAGGQGGYSGGASIGLFITYSGAPAASLPLAAGNRIQRGVGGTGGGGGYGGAGGTGGDGGDGGDSGNYWIDFKSGPGGRGGRGGEGGGGGGGCGGASLGVALYNVQNSLADALAAANTFVQDEAEKTGGTGGPAGPSGAPNPGGDGKTGHTANLHLF